MKFFIKIFIIFSTVCSAGCWDMYNEAADDLEGYNYYLAIANVDTDSFISTLSFDNSGSINFKYKTPGFTITSNQYYPCTHPKGNYIYVPNKSDNKLRIYNTDKNGNLNFSSDIDTGTGPFAAIVHPSGTSVYVSNLSIDRSISMYQCNGDSLSSLGTIQTDSTNDYRPLNLAFHPSGNFLYTSIYNNAGTIYAYIKSFSVNSDGSLNNLELIPISTGVSRHSIDIVIHPNGQLLYVYVSNATIYKFNIRENGTIDTSSVTSYGGDADYGYLSIHPSGNFLYMAGLHYIRAFNINISDGTLSAINISDTSSNNYRDILITPNGKNLYASSYSYDSIYLFNINDDGSITPSDGIQFAINGYISSPSGITLIRKKAK